MEFRLKERVSIDSAKVRMVEDGSWVGSATRLDDLQEGVQAAMEHDPG